jgi:hypothetical protein
MVSNATGCQESHQRQLLIFADNADKYIDIFSKEFEGGYLELLKRQFDTKRVHANRVYQQSNKKMQCMFKKRKDSETRCYC